MEIKKPTLGHYCEQNSGLSVGFASIFVNVLLLSQDPRQATTWHLVTRCVPSFVV